MGKPGHKFLHEAHRHTETAQEIIRELLDGPEEVNQDRLEAAAKALRLALIHIDPSLDPDKALM